MYVVRCDGEILYAPNLSFENYIITSPVLTTEVNKAGSFEFNIPPSNPQYSKYKKMKSIITVEKDGNEIFRGRITEDERSFYNEKHIYCEGELSFLNDVIIEPYDYSSGITLKNYYDLLLNTYDNNCSEFRKILPGEITAVESSTALSRKLDDYNDILSEISDKIVGELNGILEINRRNGVSYLDYKDPTNQIVDQTIRFGKNLLDLTESIDATNVYTYILPLGKKKDDGSRIDISSVNGGSKTIHSEIGESLFGKITRVLVWEDIEDPSALKNVAQEALNNAILMATNITLKAIDLSTLNVDVDPIKIGYFVHVISVPHGIDTNFMCSRIVCNLMNPSQDEYTFGLVFSALTDRQVSALKKTDNAYQTANSTSEEFNTMRTEMYENYVSSSAFSSFKSKIETQIDSITGTLGAVYKYRGTVESYINLPVEDLRNGDVYNADDTGANYAWTGEKWDKLSENIDLSNYITKTEYNELEQRVDELEKGM